MGSAFPFNRKSEKFEDDTWSDIFDPPGVEALSESAVIFHAGNFYYFGGYDGRGCYGPKCNGPTYDGRLNTIFRLKSAKWVWSVVGRLNAVRRGNSVILVENTFMVIGGVGEKPNEACLLGENGIFTCEETSSLDTYWYYPVLFLVNDEFEDCQKT